MSSRDAILHRIRTSLSQAPAVAAPPVPEVWPRQNCDTASMALRFAEELKAVHGETMRCKTIEEARQQLAQLADAEGWTWIGALDRPLVHEVTSGLAPGRLAWSKAEWPPREMAELSASVIAAECLLADTGSCVIGCRTAPERLLCYLPPSCVVVAKVEQLAEHLPAAWAQISATCADGKARGEWVLVTGPSRTADIEKILILGVHGPKRLVVLLVG
jgi:L-lactate dehydrogenase complex protein LldG